ncbi:uncharacterized protein LOC106478118 [Limulus polyphemus]|uniref:Uncharacterized protein LOC106478118 n=1 Tax=Limulus polyphemus TaxID=6850 RepID=A0ABM1S152_LIMPO|nr:uncharacterized protein LOC106478118 [Limulus polyphemus]
MFRSCFDILVVALLLFPWSNAASTSNVTEGCDVNSSVEKKIFCYFNAEDDSFKIDSINPCLCTHLVYDYWGILPNLTLSSVPGEELKALTLLKQINPQVKVLVSLRGVQTENDKNTTSKEENVVEPKALERFAESVRKFVDNFHVDGVVIDVQYRRHNRLDKLDPHKEGVTLLLKAIREALDKKIASSDRIIGVTVSRHPFSLINGYNFGHLSSYVDFFNLPAFDLVANKRGSDFSHPARLHGVGDMENMDSLVDLMLSLGVQREKLIVGIPAHGISYKMIGSTELSRSSPNAWTVPYSELCKLSGAPWWKVHREKDQTAPFVFDRDIKVGFDDEISVRLKAKYILLRKLGGATLWWINEDDSQDDCGRGHYPLLRNVWDVFSDNVKNGTKLELGLDDLEEYLEGAESQFVDVVDKVGLIDRIDGYNVKVCSRQGYYRHSEDCSRFYRCVKFNQYSEEYTIFEYDCPPGLVFDERYEVCNWPSWSPPCEGSGEVFPVPRDTFICPGPGYFHDPENCRWFYYCMDFWGNSTLQAFEFKCPFNLVFDEDKLLCNWPWLVPGCYNIYGLFGTRIRGYNGNIPRANYQEIGIDPEYKLGGLYTDEKTPYAGYDDRIQARPVLDGTNKEYLGLSGFHGNGYQTGFRQLRPYSNGLLNGQKKNYYLGRGLGGLSTGPVVKQKYLIPVPQVGSDISTFYNEQGRAGFNPHILQDGQQYISHTGQADLGFIDRGEQSYGSQVENDRPELIDEVTGDNPVLVSEVGQGSPNYDSQVKQGIPVYVSQIERGSPELIEQVEQETPGLVSEDKRGNTEFSDQVNQGFPISVSQDEQGTQDFQGKLVQGGPGFVSEGKQGVPENVDLVIQDSPECVEQCGQGSPEFIDQAKPETPEFVNQDVQETPEFLNQDVQETPEFLNQGIHVTPGFVDLGRQETPGFVDLGRQETPEFANQRQVTPAFVNQGRQGIPKLISHHQLISYGNSDKYIPETFSPTGKGSSFYYVPIARDPYLESTPNRSWLKELSIRALFETGGPYIKDQYHTRQQNEQLDTHQGKLFPLVPSIGKRFVSYFIKGDDVFRKGNGARHITPARPISPYKHTPLNPSVIIHSPQTNKEIFPYRNQYVLPETLYNGVKKPEYSYVPRRRLPVYPGRLNLRTQYTTGQERGIWPEQKPVTPYKRPVNVPYFPDIRSGGLQQTVIGYQDTGRPPSERTLNKQTLLEQPLKIQGFQTPNENYNLHLPKWETSAQEHNLKNPLKPSAVPIAHDNYNILPPNEYISEQEVPKQPFKTVNILPPRGKILVQQEVPEQPLKTLNIPVTGEYYKIPPSTVILIQEIPDQIPETLDGENYDLPPSIQEVPIQQQISEDPKNAPNIPITSYDYEQPPPNGEILLQQDILEQPLNPVDVPISDINFEPPPPNDVPTDGENYDLPPSIQEVPIQQQISEEPKNAPNIPTIADDYEQPPPSGEILLQQDILEQPLNPVDIPISDINFETPPPNDVPTDGENYDLPPSIQEVPIQQQISEEPKKAPNIPITSYDYEQPPPNGEILLQQDILEQPLNPVDVPISDINFEPPPPNDVRTDGENFPPVREVLIQPEVPGTSLEGKNENIEQPIENPIIAPPDGKNYVPPGSEEIIIQQEFPVLPDEFGKEGIGQKLNQPTIPFFNENFDSVPQEGLKYGYSDQTNESPPLLPLGGEPDLLLPNGEAVIQKEPDTVGIVPEDVSDKQSLEAAALRPPGGEFAQPPLNIETPVQEVIPIVSENLDEDIIEEKPFIVEDSPPSDYEVLLQRVEPISETPLKPVPNDFPYIDNVKDIPREDTLKINQEIPEEADNLDRFRSPLAGKLAVKGRNNIPVTACTRPGLFRHPDDCGKFYECYWDKTINKFTLHIFSCPVKLVFDEHILGCGSSWSGLPCVTKK